MSATPLPDVEMMEGSPFFFACRNANNVIASAHAPTHFLGNLSFKLIFHSLIMRQKVTSAFEQLKFIVI